MSAVAEVVFRFWTHATVEYAYYRGFGSAGARWVRPRVVVGTGPWYRTSRDTTRKTAHNMFVTLRKKYDATIVLLSDVEEASYEETATLYAHKLMKWEPPDAVISGGARVLKRWGKGTKRQSTPHLIQCGNREGKDLILAATTVEEGCEAWEKRINMRFHEAGFNRDSYIKSCTLMGACFYAAEYAEVPLKGTTIKIAKDKFEAHIRRIKKAAKKVERDGKTATTKDTLAKVKADGLGGRDAAQTLSNLMVQARICEMLGDGVSVRYVRDWKLPGADGVVEFRTTWSAGYYLQDLVRRRPYLLAAEDTGFQDLI